MNEKTVIYIAGYGRSGSTLLERILSSHKQIFGLGELTHFMGVTDGKDSFCSCGKRIQECEFWSDVTRKFQDNLDNITEFKKIQNEFESFSRFPGYVFGRRPDKGLAYREFTQTLFSIIFQKLPDEVRHIVDSSKTPRGRFFRPFALSRIAYLNVKVIHLIRDGRGCMWSNLKGDNRRMERGLDPYLPFAALRTAIHWSLGNIAAHVLQATSNPGNYCRVRYEDFVDKPAETYAKLGKFLGVSFDQQIYTLRNGGNIPLGHQIAGNRLRSQKNIVVKMDVEWKEKLRLHHRMLFWLLNWPLALLYGYK